MAIIDIPGAYLRANSDEAVIMVLKCIVAEILVNIDLNLYSKYFVLENGVKVLYVKLQKALYVLLRSTLMFYPKLATDLENNGFVIKP